MVAIARAMMAAPRLMLLDEPSLGLAPLFVARIFEQIKALRASGGTILLVEQNARLALSIADRGYVLESGRIGVAGSAAELLHNPHVQDAYLGGAGSSRAMEDSIRAIAAANPWLASSSRLASHCRILAPAKNETIRHAGRCPRLPAERMPDSIPAPREVTSYRT